MATQALHRFSALILAVPLAWGCGGSNVAFEDRDAGDGSVADASGDAEDSELLDTAVPDDTSAPADTGGAIDTGVDVGPPDTKPPGCPAGTTKKLEVCPPTCSGGCDGDVCNIRCNAINGCNDTTLACPPNARCKILCDGLNSCQRTKVQCQPGSPCELACTGTNACQGVDYTCPSFAGACTLTCSALSSCTTGKVKCGPGACAASCTGLGTTGVKVDCGPSCACSNKCPG